MHYVICSINSNVTVVCHEKTKKNQGAFLFSEEKETSWNKCKNFCKNSFGQGEIFELLFQHKLKDASYTIFSFHKQLGSSLNLQLAVIHKFEPLFFHLQWKLSCNFGKSTHKIFVKLDIRPIFCKSLFQRVVSLEKAVSFRVTQLEDQFLCLASQPKSTEKKTGNANLQNIYNLIDQEEYNVSRVVLSASILYSLTKNGNF